MYKRQLLHINVLLRKPICADALYERIKLAVTCTSRGDTVEQRLAQILRELGIDVYKRQECSRITDSRWIKVCKDHKRKDNRPFPKGRGG